MLEREAGAPAGGVEARSGDAETRGAQDMEAATGRERECQSRSAEVVSSVPCGWNSKSKQHGSSKQQGEQVESGNGATIDGLHAVDR